jgi:hypothetical protein
VGFAAAALIVYAFIAVAAAASTDFASTETATAFVATVFASKDRQSQRLVPLKTLLLHPHSLPWLLHSWFYLQFVMN